MSYFTNNEGVIEAFLNQQTANAGKLKTDGQSLFSYSRAYRPERWYCGYCCV